jgi:hypothetical protein
VDSSIDRVPGALKRRRQPARWVFIATAVPLIVIGLMGAEHGALFMYGPLAAICLFQVFYPTLLVWGFVLLLYAGGSILYLFVLGADALRLIHHQQPQVFLNPYDSTFFLLLLAVLITLTVVLIRKRPVVGRQDVA